MTSAERMRARSNSRRSAGALKRWQEKAIIGSRQERLARYRPPIQVVPEAGLSSPRAQIDAG